MNFRKFQHRITKILLAAVLPILVFGIGFSEIANAVTRSLPTSGDQDLPEIGDSVSVQISTVVSDVEVVEFKIEEILEDAEPMKVYAEHEFGSDELQYRGFIDSGSMTAHGEGNISNASDSVEVYDGIFARGKFDGKGTFWWDDLRYVGQFSEGNLHGNGKLELDRAAVGFPKDSELTGSFLYGAFSAGTAEYSSDNSRVHDSKSISKEKGAFKVSPKNQSQIADRDRGDLKNGQRWYVENPEEAVEVKDFKEVNAEDSSEEEAEDESGGSSDDSDSAESAGVIGFLPAVSFSVGSDSGLTSDIADYEGEIEDGAPDGDGKLTFASPQTISAADTDIAEEELNFFLADWISYDGGWSAGDFSGEGVLETEYFQYDGDFSQGSFAGEGRLEIKKEFADSDLPVGVIFSGDFQGTAQPGRTFIKSGVADYSTAVWPEESVSNQLSGWLLGANPAVSRDFPGCSEISQEAGVFDGSLELEMGNRTRVCQLEYFCDGESGTLTLKNEVIAGIEDSDGYDEIKSAARASCLLGTGFGEITGLQDSAQNSALDQRGGEFAAGGVGNINSLLYNVKDYLKYISASLAILWLMISVFNLITAVADEGIENAKKGITWGVIALVLTFVMDALVIAVFEGAGASPGESFATVDATGKLIENDSLLRGISSYFTQNAEELFETIKVYGGALALVFIFVAGFRMVTAAGNDEGIQKEKTFLVHAVTAFVTFIMLDTFIGVIYPTMEAVDSEGNVIEFNDPECLEYLEYGYEFNFADEKTGADQKNWVKKCAAVFDQNLALEIGVLTEKIEKADGEEKTKLEKELDTKLTSVRSAAGMIGQSASDAILGVVRFFETLLGGIAIFFLVLGGFRVIASFGNSEAVESGKKTVIWSSAGLALVMLTDNIVNIFFTTDFDTGTAEISVDQGILDIAGITNFLATFVGVFALVSLIVAGFMWVANFGNEEFASKAKQVIIASLAGIILSISAYAIVNTVLTADATDTETTEFSAAGVTIQVD